MALKSWDGICLPKTTGGLGFRRCAYFNRALLSKWGQRLLKGSTAIWAKVIRKKYIKFGNFLNTSSKVLDSLFEKGVIKTENIITRCTRKLVGRGNSIYIWIDPWVLRCQEFRPTLLVDLNLGFAWVEDFILPGRVQNILKL